MNKLKGNNLLKLGFVLILFCALNFTWLLYQMFKFYKDELNDIKDISPVELAVRFRASRSPEQVLFIANIIMFSKMTGYLGVLMILLGLIH